ncbi:hypothetical protein E2C01_046629 [Portunus trituberculatus]|uniref:Uncharacterized protein n=1 Tax=Portunus trituberculatus TaxID=210409 RepID=A0A5B7G691_PORTR|nr:hypothetical protein [Portunus trituberculatus]
MLHLYTTHITTEYNIDQVNINALYDSSNFHPKYEVTPHLITASFLLAAFTASLTSWLLFRDEKEKNLKKCKPWSSVRQSVTSPAVHLRVITWLPVCLSVQWRRRSRKECQKRIRKASTPLVNYSVSHSATPSPIRPPTSNQVTEKPSLSVYLSVRVVKEEEEEEGIRERSRKVSGNKITDV